MGGLWTLALGAGAQSFEGLLLGGNQIGLDAAGTPVNGTIGIMVRSEGGPAVTGARIMGNRVAGYTADIVVAGKDAKGTVVLG
jgi:hypothetical protein